MKKVLTAILSLAMVVVLFAGCSNSFGDAAPSGVPESAAPSSAAGTDSAKKTKVTVGLADNVNTLTPIYKISVYTCPVVGSVCENLGQWVDTEFTGVLMKNWEEIDDVTYKVELYDYITDSEGNAFTTEDVEYCIQRAQEGGITYAKYVESMDIEDDYNFTLHLTKAEVGYFEDFCQNVWMYTKEAMEASTDDMATDPVGTGPYVLVDYASSSHILFEKRDDYWQKEELIPRCSQANVDVIEFVIIKEAAQMAVALETGSVQLAYWVPTSIVADLQKVDTVKTVTTGIPQMRNMVFNCSENSIFGGENGKLLRQALCYALNEQAMVDAGLNGMGIPPKTWGKEGYIGYNPEWEKEDYYSYNPEKAKELMAQAGYPNGFSCTFWGVDNAWSRSFMQVAQANCAAVGIDMKIDWMPDNINAQMQVDLTAGWDIYQISTTSGSGYQAGYYNYLCDRTLRASGYNMFGLHDDDYLQSLVEAAGAKTWTQEDVDALHDYVVENCFVYTPFDSLNAISYVPEITEIYYRNWRRDPLIGPSTFSEDYSYYAE